MKYRDKQTGEVVEVEPGLGGFFVFRASREWGWIEEGKFNTRFEPVEDDG